MPRYKLSVKTEIKEYTMNKKQQKAEREEMEQAIRTLCAVVRSMARKKAKRYEAEFLVMARDMLNEEIESLSIIDEMLAESIGKEVAETLKPNKE